MGGRSGYLTDKEKEKLIQKYKDRIKTAENQVKAKNENKK